MAGSFSISNSPTFAANGGTVNFAAASGNAINLNSTFTFYNLTFTAGDGNQTTVGLGNTLIATGTTTFADGLVSNLWNSAAIDARGAVTVQSTYDGGDLHLKFTGTSAQTFTLTGATDKYDGPITIDKASNTVTLASDLVMLTKSRAYSNVSTA